MSYQVQAVALEFEFRRNHIIGIGSDDTESSKCRRHIQVLECTAHGILATDGRKPEFNLHLEGTEQSAQRQAPGAALMRHSLEILLI